MKIEGSENVKSYNGKEWIEEYNNLLNKVNKRHSELSKLQSEYDLEEQDILHYIELKKTDAIMNAKLMKKLKEITIKRRMVKEEISALRSIKTLSHKSKYTDEKEYTFKTNVIIDLLESEGDNNG